MGNEPSGPLRTNGLAHCAARLPGVSSLCSQNFRDGAYVFRVHDFDFKRLRGFIANDSQEFLDSQSRTALHAFQRILQVPFARRRNRPS
jgi:hypothetical protein